MAVETQRWEIRSMVGLRTGQSAVLVRIGDRKPEQFPADGARTVALALLEAAEAAEQDAAVFAWARDKLGASEAHAAAVVADLRGWREAHNR